MGFSTKAIHAGNEHDATGRAVAAFFEEHPKVQKLYYPGSLSHKQHELAKRQRQGFGGMAAFDVGSLENARTVLESVRLCTLAESLGGVETLISHPATMTHASVLPETRAPRHHRRARPHLGRPRRDRRHHRRLGPGTQQNLVLSFQSSVFSSGCLLETEN
jgi:O-acetylhomoserine/O-acetylserine sulfhydrylase-like pyridoxal-dependent enzyme